jgi:hypothetical protein
MTKGKKNAIAFCGGCALVLLNAFLNHPSGDGYYSTPPFKEGVEMGFLGYVWTRFLLADFWAVLWKKSRARAAQAEGEREALEEALKMARKRWGEEAAVDTDKGVFYVGQRVSSKNMEILGEGRTWDEAFADADLNPTES